MKKLLLFLFFNSAFCIFNFAFSQGPSVKIWDKRLGGTNNDILYSNVPTRDGGYILGGSTISGIGGDKTQDTWNGTCDFWIIKVDSAANVEWDRDFGGLADDYLMYLIQTSDGGYMIGGFTNSGIGGDKTQPLIGCYDYWIFKIDSLGNKEWDKNFGGTGCDYIRSIQQTHDGGYIFGGFSGSNAGGDKSQPRWGSNDYWILKTDSAGNKLWDKDFGNVDDDELFSIQPTDDGGYVLGGFSNSAAGGDKTQNTIGGYDYWIVKIDSSGNKQWDKDFGGTSDDKMYSLKQTADAGYILGGLSNSGIGGDKTQDTIGGDDFWIIKTDPAGMKEWDKNFGGNSTESMFGNISQTSDHGYLLAGLSASNISGDKTENNLGLAQTWTIKTDSSGMKQWDKTLMVNGKVEQGFAFQVSDRCFTMMDMNNGTIGGHKSQSPWSSSIDYWIIKFCDTTTLQALLAAPNLLCPGTCADFINLSTNSISYQWFFPGATPDTSTAVNPTNICYNTPGSYDIMLIAANANGSDTLFLSNYITVFPQPPPQSITQSGDTLFAIAGANSYQWYFNGNLIPGATDYFYASTLSGDYNVVAADGNGCEVEAAIFDVLLSTESAGDGSGLCLFPNPAFDEFTIQNAKCKMGTAVEVSVYNMMGEKVLAVDCRQLTVDCRLLPPGMYVLEMNSGSKIFRATFVKQ